MTLPLTLYKPWMQELYGTPLFRIPVEIASSCPHGRCTFCPTGGARAQQILRASDVREQISEAIRFAQRRYRAKKFMLYVQAFTADLTDPAQQELIREALDQTRFDALSIGTRPDCLNDAAFDFLSSLAITRPAPFEIWIEPGVQSLNDTTLQRIERGHDSNCAREAIRAAAARGFFVAPHIILGLPGETSSDWNQTAKELAKLPIHGIKIHNLHLIRQTALEKEYGVNPFPLLNHWDYAEALIGFLRRIPGKIPVMRLVTDTPDNELAAPRWPLEKGQFLDYLIQQMTLREIRQGDLLDQTPTGDPLQADPPAFAPVKTDDGSVTFFNPHWKEHYHCRAGARLEAHKKFVEPSGLNGLLQQRDVYLLDICFGLGTNSLAAITQAAQCANKTLHITALELDKRVVRAASSHFVKNETDPLDWSAALARLCREESIHAPFASLAIRWGDARRLVQQIPDESFDILFHDPFSSQHCPELWTVEFFQHLRRIMKPNGILLTYSSAQPVRGALRNAGLHMARTEPGPTLANGTAAARDAGRLSEQSPIDPLDPRRSIPYRDPSLCAPAKTILRNRQQALPQLPDAVKKRT